MAVCLLLDSLYWYIYTMASVHRQIDGLKPEDRWGNFMESI